MSETAAPGKAAPISERGPSPSGGSYALEVPPGWNGKLLLYSRGLPMGRDDGPWQDGDALIQALLEQGFAVAGTGGPMFWPLEPTFVNQEALLDHFARRVEEPVHTVAFGSSIGGIMTAGLVQRIPDRLSGALPLCGNLAGAVGIHNRELDIAFVIKVLLAADSTLELVRISDPHANLATAHSVLDAARGTSAGRARLALAAAVGNTPGWYDPLAPEPECHEFGKRLQNQLSWYDEPGFLVYFLLRAQVEQRAGGNPSWNHGVDYRALLEQSSGRDEVEGLYEVAEVDLESDLGLLATAPRIDADPAAVSYLERNIVFSGDLGGVPVLAVHTEGDGLVTPDNEHAYADIVAARGQQELLRQLFIHRGGHCTFTVAEVVVALRALLERVDTGSWPALDAASLNTAAAELGAEYSVLVRGGQPTNAAFSAFVPQPFPRQYDARDPEQNQR